jgi:protein-S-isoprenylcysteine O-methyltransferase Ste14
MIVGRFISFLAQWLVANALFLALASGSSGHVGDFHWTVLLVVLNILWVVPLIGSVYVPEERIRTTANAYCYYLWMGAMLVELGAVGYDYAHVRSGGGPSAAESVLGLVLIGLGFLASGVAWLSIRRYSAPEFQIIEGHKVVDWGLYRFIRHPIYLGFFLLGLGLPLFVRSIVGLVAFIVVVAPTWLYVIMREEEFLVSELGSDYSNYIQRTKRLLPFIY